MRIPQPPERIKEVPALALRAVFAGVGQVLLITERVRRRTIGQVHSSPVSVGGPDSSGGPGGSGRPETAGPNGARTSSVATAPAPTPAAQARSAPARATEATAVKTSPRQTTRPSGTRSPAADKPAAANKPPATRKPRAASKSPAAATPPAATRPPAAATPPAATAKPPAAATPPVPEGAPSPAVISATAELPLLNYQELTFASLRARMRGLDADQIRGLLDYERTHADRTSVITMFERRIAKLEGTEDADTATP